MRNQSEDSSERDHVRKVWHAGTPRQSVAIARFRTYCTATVVTSDDGDLLGSIALLTVLQQQAGRISASISIAHLG